MSQTIAEIHAKFVPIVAKEYTLPITMDQANFFAVGSQT